MTVETIVALRETPDAVKLPWDRECGNGRLYTAELSELLAAGRHPIRRAGVRVQMPGIEARILSTYLHP